MARKQVALIVVGLAVAGLITRGQEPRPPADPLATPAKKSPNPDQPKADKPDQDKPDQDKPDRDHPDHDRPHHPFGGPEAEKAREAFRNMTPEEREQWMKRFREWAEMSPEKKKSLLDREEFFKRRVREDIDAAIQQSGLTLNDDQKKQFSQRYMEERRKIEEELRKQMDEIRRPKVQALIEKLKQEFTAPVDAKPETPK